MINKQEVEHIAKLSRLALSEKETEKMQKDLSAILDYVDVLKKAPKVKVVREMPESASLRKDEVGQKHSGTRENIVKAFPESKDNYIKVKSIL